MENKVRFRDLHGSVGIFLFAWFIANHFLEPYKGETVMNRGPFLHGMYRYAEVKNKKNRRYKKISLKRLIINCIFFALAVAVLIITFVKGMGQIFIAGAIFFLALASIPFVAACGKNMIMYELEIVSNQKRAEMPLDFSVKRAKIGYILMFSPFYILMFACFLIPIEKAWVVPYIPVCAYNTISILLSAHTVETFDFSIKNIKPYISFLI